MKKEYSKPSTKVIVLQPFQLLQGSGVYTDDPQKPGAALSRRHGLWDDDEE